MTSAVTRRQGDKDDKMIGLTNLCPVILSPVTLSGLWYY